MVLTGMAGCRLQRQRETFPHLHHCSLTLFSDSITTKSCGCICNKQMLAENIWMVRTDLLFVPQVEEVQVALITHLLVCREHNDVAAEVEATRSDSRVGVEQGQLFTWRGDSALTVCDKEHTRSPLFTLVHFYLPVSQSHSRQLLSADPVRTCFVSPKSALRTRTCVTHRLVQVQTLHHRYTRLSIISTLGKSINNLLS